MNEAFIPLAARAPLVNGLQEAGNADEKRLYARLRRVMLAPQGIGVLDAEGRVLEWTQMFDDEASVLAFLEHALARETGKAPAAERYMHYPSEAQEEVAFEEDGDALAEAHPKGEACPAASARHGAGPAGALEVDLTGRALDAEGRLAGDTVRQESYVEDKFVIDAETQRAIAEAARGKGRVRLPDAFGRLLALYAYLGHIDVRPLENPRKGEGELTRCEMWGTMEEGTVRVEGDTDVRGSLAGGGGHEHAVALAWKGRLDVEGEHVTGLVLIGEGMERLRFDAEGHSVDARGGEETFLPAGRPVDIDTRVRYGLIGTPITAEQAVAPVEDRGAKLQRKMKAIGEGVQRWQRQGQDPAPIGRIMQRFEPLVKAGKIDEAEAVLDEALRALDE